MHALLTRDLADRFARIALAHLEREYPDKLDHVLARDEDACAPRALHPIFFGSFDWHSCVHGYWLLAVLQRLFPDLAARPEIVALFDRRLTPEGVEGELAYLARPESTGFERPYGWAWLLMLQAELEGAEGPWAKSLAPLAEAFAGRFSAYLPKLTYPVRAGTHANSAFAIRLAYAYAVGRDPELERALGRRRSAGS